MKRIGDIWAVGNLLVAIFIFSLAYVQTSALIKFIGIIGSVILGISQLYYLLEHLK